MEKKSKMDSLMALVSKMKELQGESAKPKAAVIEMHEEHELPIDPSEVGALPGSRESSSTIPEEFTESPHELSASEQELPDSEEEESSGHEALESPEEEAKEHEQEVSDEDDNEDEEMPEAKFPPALLKLLKDHLMKA
jgi:hypothetical protein